MENSKNERVLQLCYTKLEGKDGLYLQGIYFDDLNMLNRFGEWLAVMNEIDSFYLYDMSEDHAVAVDMEPLLDNYDKEEFYEWDEDRINAQAITASNYAQNVDKD